MEKMVDIEKLLSEGNNVKIKPQGWSMYPLIVYGRDKVIIEPPVAKRYKRGEVVLYRRETGILVLHRIYKTDSEGYYMVGDNQTEIEGPIKHAQIKGQMAAVVRKERVIPVSSPCYKIYSNLWLILRPVRPLISKIVHKIKNIK